MGGGVNGGGVNNEVQRQRNNSMANKEVLK